MFACFKNTPYLCIRFRLERGACDERKSSLKDLHKTDTNSSTRSECCFFCITWVKEEANRQCFFTGTVHGLQYYPTVVLSRIHVPFACKACDEGLR